MGWWAAVTYQSSRRLRWGFWGGADSDTPAPGADSSIPPASQLKKLDLAAAAAHTFFVANPAHLQMREDMAKYRRMSGVRPQSFRDLETPPYWVRPSA